jgi:SAM-dependent methyltransferase
MEGLFAYYREQPILPTFADLRTAEAFASYATARAAMLRDKAGLPPEAFAGRDVLEFGPDSGENALVFASWGARMSLVEPNAAAHGPINDYFDRFGMRGALRDLASMEVLAYRSDERFDFIVAEGFIYTVQPTRAWLDVFHRHLRPGGRFLVTYYERHGALIELLLSTIHRMHRRRTGLGPVAAARAIYAAKWDAIPHTRAFESWVMDVLENPYLDPMLFVDARVFLDDLEACGFELATAHPHYDDVLAIDWHKRVVPRAERIARAKRHLERSTLSFLAGRKLYIVDAAVASGVRQTADALIADVAALREADDAGRVGRCITALHALASTANEASLIADRDDDRARAAALFTSFARALELAASDDVDALRAHTTGDRAFVEGWGMPVHVAVGRVRDAG